jgi:FdhD protein
MRLSPPGGDEAPRELVEEEPLSIIVQGKSYAVVMRTPGDERAHVAGFALAEGLLDARGDIHHISLCEREETSFVALTLTEERRAQVGDLLERKSFLSQTSCGLCGKEVVADLTQKVRPFDDGPIVTAAGMAECVQALCAHQALYSSTRASHAASLFDLDYQLLALAEDVGRHNAVDKAVGKLLLRDELGRAQILLASSRISYELVQKAARARVPIVIALSHPTALAVELAEKLNMTVVTIRERTGTTVYCGGGRIR